MIVQESLRAIRQNFVPGLVIWTVAALVVAAYYLVPATSGFFQTIAAWKASGGFLYSFAATALFAGLIPFAFLMVMPATRAQATGSALAFLLIFWGYRGVEIDLLYRLQGVMFGTAPAVGTIAAKVAFDLFVYNVVWAAGLQLLVYHWKNHRYRLKAFHGFHWHEFFTKRLPVAVVSTWVIWLPVVTLVYSLPADLQIPLFNLAACFWSMVVATLTSEKRVKSS
jgi:hypothetical protein